MRKFIPLALMLPVLLTACGEPSGPEGELRFRLAHVAPGAGTFVLSIDGGVLDPAMVAGEVVDHTAGLGRHTIRFQGDAGVSEINLDFSGSADFAVLLRDPADPHIRVFRAPSENVQAEVVLSIVNMVPGSTALTVSLAGVATASGLGYGSDITFGLAEGEYTVLVSDGTGAEPIDLGSVVLTSDHAFLVVMPDPEGAIAGGFVAF